MAAAYIKIDTDRLGADIKQLNESIASVQKSMSELVSEIEQLNTMWKGEANTAFRVQTEKDFNYMKQIIKGFQEFASDMEGAKRDYIRCENQVTDEVNRIRI